MCSVLCKYPCCVYNTHFLQLLQPCVFGRGFVYLPVRVCLTASFTFILRIMRRLVLIDRDFTLLDHSIDEGHFLIRPQHTQHNTHIKKGDFVIIFILIASTYQTSDLLMNPRRLGQQFDSDWRHTHTFP